MTDACAVSGRYKLLYHSFLKNTTKLHAQFSRPLPETGGLSTVLEVTSGEVGTPSQRQSPQADECQGKEQTKEGEHKVRPYEVMLRPA